MSETISKKRVKVKAEEKEESSSSSEEGPSSSDESSALGGTEAASVSTATGKSKTESSGGKKKAKKGTSSSADVGPMLTMKHPNREGFLWTPDVISRFPVAEILGELGVDGKVEMTGDALAILQASVDVLTDRTLSESILYIHLLKGRGLLTAPNTGGPYLEGEKKKGPRPGEEATPDYTIYPRHVDTVLRADQWLSSVAGRRFSTSSNVFMPSITLAGPKKKGSK